jgi:peptide/nickel transport system permease protein
MTDLGATIPPTGGFARSRLSTRRFRGSRSRSVWIFWLLVVGGLLLAWLFRDALTRYGPASVQPSRVLLPMGSPGSILGTDGFGRDTLARLLAGVPVSLVAGILPATAAMALGIVIGLVAGVFGGWVDRVSMAVMDVLLGFPFILLAILFVAVLGPSLQNAMVAVTLAILPKNARLIRAEALSLRERDYVVAARLSGASQAVVMVRHLLPNVLPTALIVGSTDVGSMIGATAGLSFLGLGVQAPDVDWGTLISDGAKYVTVAPQVALLPSALVALVSLVFVLLGDDLRRHMSTGD